MDDWGRGKCTLTFDPPLAASTRGWVRAAVDGTVLASWNAQEMSGSLHTLGPATAWTTLPASDRVNTTTPTLMWEVSPDGEHWFPAGTSGPHTMYWTEASPIVPPFVTRVLGPLPQLYDKALQWACAARDPEEFPDEPSLPESINRLVDKYSLYDPRQAVPGHPLLAFERTEGQQCESHADLLAGLLRSVGIEAETTFMWNGVGATPYQYTWAGNGFITFEVDQVAHDEGLANPHFTFHAVVSARRSSGGELILLDPSYGRNDNIVFSECVDPSTLEFTSGNGSRVLSSLLPGPGFQTGKTCTHPPAQ